MKNAICLSVLAGLALLAVGMGLSVPGLSQSVVPNLDGGHLFASSDSCLACHNGVTSASGEDLSIGFLWRASMMANAARDPYWHAAVRREVTDHPEVQSAIEHECSKCHMPMARYEANLAGRENGVFEHLPIGSSDDDAALLAADGVSCTVCHQISGENLGTEESLVGGFIIDPDAGDGERPVYGPFEVNDGRMSVMRSATGFRQVEASHIRDSELCATCHTLITEARGPGGEVIGELPEQVPYQEWLHSRYSETDSCQDCHLPRSGEAPASSILSELREGVGRHDFTGSNFFITDMLNRFRNDLGVRALPQELTLAATRAKDHLASETATISVENVLLEDAHLTADVLVRSQAGHKLPTAYPSRRVWIEFVVRDSAGATLFSSGALREDGSIVGNDNDADPALYEPHYTEIHEPDEVQIYESILLDSDDQVTTGLLNGVGYAKDNRVLPEGFDKTTADEWIEVHGGAFDDSDFTGGSDRIRYSLDLGGADGPLTIEATLWYQVVGFRWADNLRAYDAFEPRRFVSYYESMAPASGAVLARTAVDVE